MKTNLNITQIEKSRKEAETMANKEDFDNTKILSTLLGTNTIFMGFYIDLIDGDIDFSEFKRISIKLTRKLES